MKFVIMPKSEKGVKALEKLESEANNFIIRRILRIERDGTNLTLLPREMSNIRVQKGKVASDHGVSFISQFMGLFGAEIEKDFEVKSG